MSRQPEESDCSFSDGEDEGLPRTTDDEAIVEQETSEDLEDHVSTLLKNILEKLENSKSSGSREKDPMDPKSAEIYDMMNDIADRVTRKEGEGQRTPGEAMRNLMNMGDMLEKVGRLYSAEVDFMEQFVLEAWEKINMHNNKKDKKLSMRPVVVLERLEQSEGLSQQGEGANAKKRKEQGASPGKNTVADVTLSPQVVVHRLPQEVLEQHINRAASETFENNFMPDLDFADVATDSLPIVDSPGSELRRSERLRPNLLLTGCFGRQKISKPRDKIRWPMVSENQDGTHENQLDEPWLDAEFDYMDNLDQDVDFNDEPQSTDPNVICDYRVSQTKNTLNEVDLTSRCLRNNRGEAYGSAEYRKKRLESTQAIVQKFIKTIKSFDEPLITSLIDIQANELSDKVQKALDDTANRTHRIELLKCVQEASQEIEASPEPASENIDSGIEIDLEQCQESAIPCLGVIGVVNPGSRSRSHSRESRSSLHGSPVSIQSVDSAYQTQEEDSSCPLECSQALKNFSETPMNPTDANTNLRFVSANAVFKKLCDKRDTSDRDLTRYAYELTSLIAGKYLSINFKSVRSESNEEYLAGVFEKQKVTMNTDSLEESMSRLGSICPSVLDSSCKLEIRLTQDGSEQIRKDTSVTKDPQGNNITTPNTARFLEDEEQELREVAFNPKQGRRRNFNLHSARSSSSASKKRTSRVVIGKLQLLGKRKLTFDFNDHDE